MNVDKRDKIVNAGLIAISVISTVLLFSKDYRLKWLWFLYMAAP